ncbi:MAG: helix-turn-helix transcriptional regulator [Treponema sp.]|nr:helix-turn-helix transcriptional regulator [Treponema sp.]
MDQYQQEFIENLKKYRKKRGLSQERLAELCNVSTGTIGNIECGIGKPSFDLLVTMANVLGIHPARLLSDDEKKSLKDERAEAEHTLLMEFYTRVKKNFVPDRLQP